MSNQVFAPLLSEADPPVSAEGAIDPLGLYRIADELAVRLVPDVRERQERPRWLTVIAAGLVICDRFEPETVAADGHSEPWQVFEWYVVEGLVRQAPEDQTVGLPGRLKARQVLREGVRLCATRYLKTPTVFGAHGIYRALARGTEVEVAGQPGETGIELLQAWADAQGLDGFLNGRGAGGQLRRQLGDAVEEGLAQGAVARKGGWSGWGAIVEHFSPGWASPREAHVIQRALMAPGAGLRGTMLRALTSAAGQAVWAEHQSERAFHEWLRPQAELELRQLLDAILAYERWSRLLQDAFDDCLRYLSQKRTRTGMAELAALPAVRAAHREAAEAFTEVAACIESFEPEASQFRSGFAELSEPTTTAAWVAGLLEHHSRVQRAKPPHGKNPWLERFDDGTVAIRPEYVREEGPQGDGSYVHGYRTASLWSFASDLGMLD